MDPLTFAPADGAGGAGFCGDDAEGQGRGVEVGPDQAAADRGMEQLEQEQRFPLEGMGSREETREAILYLRPWIIESAEEPYRKPIMGLLGGSVR